VYVHDLILVNLPNLIKISDHLIDEGLLW